MNYFGKILYWLQFYLSYKHLFHNNAPYYFNLLCTSFLSSIAMRIFLCIFVHWNSWVPAQIFASFFSSNIISVFVIVGINWIGFIIIVRFSCRKKVSSMPNRIGNNWFRNGRISVLLRFLWNCSINQIVAFFIEIGSKTRGNFSFSSFCSLIFSRFLVVSEN